jgi:hypothetical protein
MKKSDLPVQLKSSGFDSKILTTVLAIVDAAEKGPVCERKLVTNGTHIKFYFAGYPTFGKEICALLVKVGKSFLSVHFAGYRSKTELTRLIESSGIPTALISGDENEKDQFDWKLKVSTDWLMESSTNADKVASFVTAGITKYRS